MIYCKNCILPDTRPGIILDQEGICTGCRGHQKKIDQIDWKKRYKILENIIRNTKKKSRGYDCIVPVSGGKDSWYQLILAKEHNLKILALTWKTPSRTNIGQENLDNMLKSLNVDHIDYSFAIETEKKFLVAAFEKTGIPGLPMHLAIFSMCTKMAILLQIPLVIWGENPQLEYGGTDKEQLKTDLDFDWIKKHGCMNETKANDWIGKNGLTRKDLEPYIIPTYSDYKIKSIFLGSFIKWNSINILKKVQSYGFKYKKNKGKVGAWDFADIDCNFISLHHYLKWHKFGMTRAFDNLSVQIRYGMISRDEAIDIIKRKGDQTPYKDIEIYCKFVEKSESWFWRVCEKFRNKKIWYKEKKIWKIKNFIIPNWKWNEN